MVDGTVRYRMTARQGIVFAFLCGLLIAGANWSPAAVFEPLNRHTAAMAGRILTFFGTAPVGEGASLSLDGFPVRIITECSALYMAILFISFVIAYSASLTRKVAGVLLALPAFDLVNSLRIAAVVMIGAHYPRFFDLVHVYLGQVMMVLTVICTCMAWLRRGETFDGESSLPDFLARLMWISGLLFIPWLYLNSRYVAVSDYPISFLFSRFGNPVDIPHDRHIYSQTFNLVTFFALVLATASVTPRRKAIGLGTGFVILWFGHQAFRLANVLLSAFNVEAAFRLSTGIYLVFEYLMPVILWLAILYWHRHREGKAGAGRM